ncbi:hypothetical protein J7E62_31365 [Variovorax paradoxus]|nr:hypothetical protein [Variovorax paradoxus]
MELPDAQSWHSWRKRGDHLLALIVHHGSLSTPQFTERKRLMRNTASSGSDESARLGAWAPGRSEPAIRLRVTQELRKKGVVCFVAGHYGCGRAT